MYRIRFFTYMPLTLVIIFITLMPINAQTTTPKSDRKRTTSMISLLKVQGKEQPIRGINLAWLNGMYRHDFGINPLHKDWGFSFNSNDLSRYFDDIQRMNLNVVRIWVFEDLEGLIFDKEGYVASLDENLVQNFDTAVKLAQNKDLSLYLALANNYRLSCNTGGFPDIVTDTQARKSYLERAVKPFVERYKGNKAIFAFDIMNEPEGEIAGNKGNWRNDGYNWNQMQVFIRENASAIHSADPTRLVSCGSGWHGPANIKNGLYSKLGLDFYDFHEYRNDGYLPRVSDLNVDRPVIIGEFNQDNQKEIHNDRVQNDAVAAFLRNARDGGYAGAIVWYYDHPGTKKESFLSILQGNGSADWRPACYTLRDFHWEQPNTKPKVR